MGRCLHCNKQVSMCDTYCSISCSDIGDKYYAELSDEQLNLKHTEVEIKKQLIKKYNMKGLQ